MFAKKNLPKKKIMPKNIFAGKYKIHQKSRSKQGPDKVNVRWRQSNHNLDLNYNLMGFDTIEINLVQPKKRILSIAGGKKSFEPKFLFGSSAFFLWWAL